MIDGSEVDQIDAAQFGRVVAKLKQRTFRGMKRLDEARNPGTRTQGWSQVIGCVGDLNVEVWFDRYLNRTGDRLFSFWMSHSSELRIDSLSKKSRVPMEPRTAAHRDQGSDDFALKSGKAWMGVWFVDKWRRAEGYDDEVHYVGRYTPQGHPGHGDDVIAASLADDISDLVRVAVSGGEPLTGKAPYVPSDEATMRLVEQRAGQGLFREGVLRRFGSRCVVSDCDVEAVLEAAHIIPYAEGRSQDPGVGLLLRADLHTLFDRGLLTFSRTGHGARVELAPWLKDSADYRHFEGDLRTGVVLTEEHWNALDARKTKR